MDTTHDRTAEYATGPGDYRSLARRDLGTFLDEVGQDSIRIDLGTAYTAARHRRRGTPVPFRAG
jgi:hypothetical protein